MNIKVCMAILLFGYGCTKNISTSMNSDPTFPKGNKVTNNNFVGNVYVQMFAQNDTVHNVSLGSVIFEPGARTNWHVHPGGQILMVTDGIGYYQERGKDAIIIQKGDIIRCAKDTEHWHTASKENLITYLALYDGSKPTVWTEQLTQEYYDSIAKKLSAEKK